MKPIRKLYFQNAAGERRSLNGDAGIYATDLSGFGFILEPIFADISRGFFPVVKDDSEPQTPLSFTVVLTKAAYSAYKQLTDWLAAAGSLTIIYDPTGKQEYFRDVTVDYVQKGELTRVGWLELPCRFSSNTPWYLPTPTTLSLAPSGPGKRYPYAYSKNLRYGTGGTAALQALIAGSGHIPGALTLSVRGALANPRIRLVGNVTGKTHGLCSLSTVLDETDVLQYSSRYEDAHVRRIRADGTMEDLLDFLDLKTVPFFHIPVNEPCVLSVESDAAFSGRAELLIYYYFRSV